MFSSTLQPRKKCPNRSEMLSEVFCSCHGVITFLFGIKVTLPSYRQCILMVFYEKYRVLCIFVGKRR